MAWQEEDADANRQGLTIAEYKELGGPGMGGCPAGPGDVAAPTPGSATAQRSLDKKSVAVKWAPATAAPGAAPVTGYNVVAIAKGTGQRAQLGFVTDAAATASTITGLTDTVDYDVEVRSITTEAAAGVTRMSESFKVTVGTGAPADPTLPSDTTAPQITSPAASGTPVEATSVTLTSDDTAADLWYTTGTESVITAGLPSDAAQLYKEPIPVPATGLTLHVAAFDEAGNFTTRTVEFINGTPAPTPTTPAAPTVVAAANITQNSATASWNLVDGATSYQVKVSSVGADGILTALTTQPPAVTGSTTSPVTQQITGLTGGTTYQYTVTATNPAGSTTSAASANFTTQPATDRVTITTARWKAGDFRVSGTGSVNGGTVQIYRANADGTIGTQTIGTPTAIAAGVYDIRLRNGAAPATNPGRIFVKSNGGGVAGPFTVTNG
jgi:Fibronectin type III domain